MPTMTPDQIRRVRASFALIIPTADAAAGLFYSNLFEADPSLRPLFKSDLKSQGSKLVQVLGAAVGLLDKPQVLTPVLRQLGQRHVGYGVQPEHYVTVRQALLRTLEQALGSSFGPATREAWVTMLTFVSERMIEAAEQLWDEPAPQAA
jgi:hemoglobin-like flavoprotein